MVRLCRAGRFLRKLVRAWIVLNDGRITGNIVGIRVRDGDRRTPHTQQRGGDESPHGHPLEGSPLPLAGQGGWVSGRGPGRAGQLHIERDHPSSSTLTPPPSIGRFHRRPKPAFTCNTHP